uniref:YqaJ viral recombinase domain-containing protein n=1 Tax=candidate division CPR3 bacterium TaxID=2268181 RepID=A0A7V3N5U6_UNCC3
MKIDELLYNYINQETKEPRQLGRYWSSDLYSIVKGYLTPENFFESSKVDLEGCKKMITGVAFENMLNQIFTEMKINYEYQVKKEYQVNDEIVLVAKPDFVFPNFILETKFPFSLVKNNEIPLRYKAQCEAYYRIFNYKDVYLGVFKVPFDVDFIRYNPSHWLWKKILNSLTEFHQKLKIYVQKNPKNL